MGWMYVERTTAMMGGMIETISAVSAVQRSWSRATPGSRGSTSDGAVALATGLRQHRRGWAGGLCRC